MLHEFPLCVVKDDGVKDMMILDGPQFLAAIYFKKSTVGWGLNLELIYT